MERILVVVAMEAEAAPLVEALDATRLDPHAALPMQTYETAHDGLAVRIVVNGRDPRFDVDSIGTVPAALTTHAAIEAWQPDLVMSVGTAGGWQRHGTAVGDVFLAWNRFVFHDHRIELPAFGGLATGDLPAADLREPAARVGLKLGVVTTGDSLDEGTEDGARIEASGAAVKDMEGAAVAWVAGLHEVPVTAVKAVTDLVDHPSSTSEQFLSNLAAASAALRTSTLAMLGAIAREK